METNNYILTWKGYAWKNLFSVQSYERAYFLIELFTLSRYVHTAILFERDERWYLYQAVPKGVVVEETDLAWIKEQIMQERVESYRVTDPVMSQRLQSAINVPTIGGKYNYSGIFSQLWYQLFGKKLPPSNITKKAFCSELVASVLKLDGNPMQYTPEDVDDLHFLVHEIPQPTQHLNNP